VSYPTSEEMKVWFAAQDAAKGEQMAEKYASIEEAFHALNPSHEIQCMASKIYPHQKVVAYEKSGSCQVADTEGLPRPSDREPYSTVRYGTVFYFHASTLKKGACVEWNGRIWEVLFNYLTRDSAGSLAYQCIYLLEVAQLLPE